ncbi:hypothetical protein BaRGS_00008308 [Batillaria attramentaria]|uniref:Uncharacterized protein n=1 Tax=Batillaria attramentaria TaxID=370345 RepID=A0ABD0LMD1_9CAEN
MASHEEAISHFIFFGLTPFLWMGSLAATKRDRAEDARDRRMPPLRIAPFSFHFYLQLIREFWQIASEQLKYYTRFILA